MAQNKKNTPQTQTRHAPTGYGDVKAVFGSALGTNVCVLNVEAKPKKADV
jgi:hypothetical protein